MDMSPAFLSRRLNAIIASIDAGGAAGSLEIYGTTRPSPGAAAGGSPLVTITHAYPCGVASGNGIDLADTDFFQVVASGAAIWARQKDSTGAWVADYKAGLTSDSTAEVTLTTTAFFAGAFVGLIGARINVIN